MRRHQRGAALLIAVALLGLLAIATLARALSTPAGVERQLATEHALTRARDALVAYGALGNAAGNQNNSPGALPCPDLDNDGVSEQLAGNCISDIGRLPWRTLGLGPLTDGAGECLWYARSATFSNNIQTSERGTSADKPALNPSTPGGIVEITAGGPSGQRVAAVIIAPGAALPGQSRGGTYSSAGCRDGGVEQFVEGVTVDGIFYSHASGVFAIALRSRDDFNDSVLAVGTTRLFSAAGARVLGEISLSGDGTPPYDWWTTNAWCEHVCVSPSGTGASVRLADGSQVSRLLQILPVCAAPCTGT